MTNKKLGKILANETLSISDMYMKANNVKTIDKQFWMMFHLGFVACLKLKGASEEDTFKVIEFAQKELEKLTS